MYSKGTITILQVTINAGYKLKLYPFKLVISPEGIPKLSTDTNKLQHILWKLSVAYFVVTQAIYLAFGIWFDLSYDIPIIKRAQFYALLPAFIMGISCLVAMQIFYKELTLLTNILLLFGHKLRKY